MLRLYTAAAAYNGGPSRYLLRRNGVALLPVMTADELIGVSRDRRVAEDVRSFLAGTFVA